MHHSLIYPYVPFIDIFLCAIHWYILICNIFLMLKWFFKIVVNVIIIFHYSDKWIHKRAFIQYNGKYLLEKMKEIPSWMFISWNPAKLSLIWGIFEIQSLLSKNRRESRIKNQKMRHIIIILFKSLYRPHYINWSRKLKNFEEKKSILA